MKNKHFFFFFLFLFLIQGTDACAPREHVRFQKYTTEAMHTALTAGQPTIVYFSTAWCPTCYKLKQETFTDPQVIQALSNYQKFKVDLSYVHQPDIIAIANQYEIRSVPAVVLIGPGGRNPMRIRGFIVADEFLKVLKQVEQ
ncbi:MAG: hypothetical protein A3G33_06275 [Omnitrophica bacterium RIFCSPLOWO2_12_FULL_44_17]|uniref:Thioredoxin domain-containing protein n=1 Tax=Candidatus Danuiimicrobium aquiferis TaxID=1801832 RepID=A0A1G1KVH7_9BACT|nr:MAG: hypothetical protein A3B72_04820 [Omnitrophica bacterium RIFCSPHIGHO2_02_FULL_45_28]OGW88710.1 MAG: hypothetical protein A3E74_09600 [Omnitrophica bacterium RIFCSPHIGHO2_12_FULL_44_12]OGW96890.1 MAG: hypothetical protein A3G33_06275 [Omnitrophica bacterium RIFCSPLOWO2_12_FULL_44_17]OGX02423.1 MAG: hypothetical protein A3J12_05020 [Omnitrophica bacterium RIFCSPLOWO2_02_FULL_44_11]